MTTTDLIKGDVLVLDDGREVVFERRAKFFDRFAIVRDPSFRPRKEHAVHEERIVRRIGVVAFVDVGGGK